MCKFPKEPGLGPGHRTSKVAQPEAFPARCGLLSMTSRLAIIKGVLKGQAHRHYLPFSLLLSLRGYKLVQYPARYVRSSETFSSPHWRPFRYLLSP